MSLLSAAASAIDLVTIKPKRSIGSISAYVTIEEQHSDTLAVTEHPVEQGAEINDHAYRKPSQLTIQAGWSDAGGGSSGGGGIGGLIGNAESLVSGISNLGSGGISGALSGVSNIVNSAENLAAGASNLVSGVESALSGGGGILGAAKSLLSGSLGSLTSPSYAKGVYDQLLDLQASRQTFTITTGKRVYKNMLMIDLSTTTDAATANVLIVRATFREIIIVMTSVAPAQTAATQAAPQKTAGLLNAGLKALAPVTTAISTVTQAAAQAKSVLGAVTHLI